MSLRTLVFEPCLVRTVKLLTIFVCADVLKNVEQIEADICEIYLILLRTCREFNSFNSDFHFFPEKQEMIRVNSQAQ